MDRLTKSFGVPYGGHKNLYQENRGCRLQEEEGKTSDTTIDSPLRWLRTRSGTTVCDSCNHGVTTTVTGTVDITVSQSSITSVRVVVVTIRSTKEEFRLSYGAIEVTLTRNTKIKE